jgi:hypothetical protein
MVQFTVGQRVKCLATHFDDGPDKCGKSCSERHLKDTNSTWVYGVVKKKLKARNMHKVLHDGDTSQMKSSGSHLQAHTVLDDASDSSDDEDDDAANSDKEEAAMEEDDGLTAGPSGGRNYPPRPRRGVRLRRQFRSLRSCPTRPCT